MQEDLNSHFIKNIEIKNFKCFDNFKAEGFGRVNLIGGKNNVGKTAFMEACYLSQSEKTEELFGRLLEIKTHRDVINNLLLTSRREEDLQKLIKDNIGLEIYIKGKGGYELIEEKDSYGNVEYQDYKEWEDGLVKIEFLKTIDVYAKHTKINVYPPLHIKGEEITSSYPDRYTFSTLIELLNFSFDSTKKQFSLNFISPYSNSNEELENIIGQSKLDNKYDKLNEYLLEVFNISNIDIIKNKPMLKSNGEYKELSYFGQGIKTFINIISSILLLKDDVIFIDELENGIHYTNLDKLWEIILTISKEQNVQVFATTHSKECIESYARVAKRLEDEEIGFIELGRNKKNELDAVVMDSEMFQRFIKLGNEVRGW
jgi:AAA15 family ATPase/GTPase